MEVSAAELGDARAVLIAGPTASGKSALALGLAEELARQGRPAVIVNADSMQVYDALRILTARPSPDEEARVPHRLFGHVPAEERYSVGRWLADAKAVLEKAWAEGQLPLVVGGTGLYFKALTDGLAEMPDIPAAVRRRWSYRATEVGAEGLHRLLRRCDPVAAAAIPPTDTQRLVRALEVIDATGRSIRDWQRQAAAAPLVDPAGARRFVLLPDRAELYGRIDRRLEAMMAAGALDEVRALMTRGLDPDLPVMKATGVRELAAHLSGATPLETALERAKTETRRYAKRQLTWLRTQMGPGWEAIA
ncbi:MAG TPA: tRNA (adenosine(37)-N6)-dimethylallyltransferase MiaA [Afifellaceae bacterium]|nr:tRNA (adenosine(37)-N6)-dimethylallyltransferase MiaA [Afifellaceae bacterium]